MPGGGSEHLAYIQSVEHLFLLLRRQGLMLSPADMQLAEEWAQAGIPLRVVCRAVVDAVGRYRDRHGDRPLPSSLRYFASAVTDEAERHRERTLRPEAGAADATGEAAICALVEDLVLIGRTEPNAAVRQAYRRAWRRLVELRQKASAGTAGPLAARLLALDAALLDDLWEGLPPEDQGELESAIDTRLAPERPRLGVRGLEERWRALRDEELTRRYDLFRIWQE